MTIISGHGQVTNTGCLMCMQLTDCFKEHKDQILLQFSELMLYQDKNKFHA